MPETVLVWHHRDLRLNDNPALEKALGQGGPVIPVFIWSPEEEGGWPPGAASRWWLRQSLAAFQADLSRLGARLVIRRGPVLAALKLLFQETGARALYWNRSHEPVVCQRDALVRQVFAAEGGETQCFDGALLFEPERLVNRSGQPFRVFTPFWRECLRQPEPLPPSPPPERWVSPARWPASLELDELNLEPAVDWVAGMRRVWQPGEAGAHARLAQFAAAGWEQYGDRRNAPGMEGTSRLSPHLHFGEISPRQIWRTLQQRAESRRAQRDTKAKPQDWRQSQFVTELGWREFAHHLLFHFPQTTDHPLRGQYEAFPWRQDAVALRAWQSGKTGYPLVDAGLRELWATGWMHNRVRMVAASFLVKHLRISWLAGARWFWDTLVDADLASNTLGWQWVAGCGADAAPYFRIFNPAAQGEKFDADGSYIRRWVPELAKVPSRWIHRPWEAPALVLTQSGVALGKDYPRPIVNHFAARQSALEAFASIKEKLKPRA